MSFRNSARQWAVPVLVFCALTAGCVGSRGTSEPVTEPEPERAEPSIPGEETEGVLHVVQPGETLWRIARTYGIDLDELAEANQIEDPAVLEAGRALLVPGATETLQIPPAVAITIPTGIRFFWPVPRGRVISYYGAPRNGHKHAGIDIGATHGESVIAALAGRVSYAASTMRGYGKTVILEHGDGYSSLYAHNSRLLVGEGDWVEAGQEIARIGRTGNASADHCHFEIRRGGVAVNPLPYLQDPEERR